MRLDVVSSMTIGATRREFVASGRGLPVQRAAVGLALVRIAARAVDRLEIVGVGQIFRIGVLMTKNALHLGMDRGGVVIRVDEDRELLAVSGTRQVRVLVAHEAVFVLLRDGGNDEQHGKQTDQPAERLRGDAYSHL